MCGTVNDLAVGGAVPLYLSCAVDHRGGGARSICCAGSRARWRAAAREAGVKIVTGDTKVVQQGACDKLFLTTDRHRRRSAAASTLGARSVRPGDAVLVNGVLGDHGAAILAARGDLALETPIESDCAPLNGLSRRCSPRRPATRFMRDATRGGVATVLNEIAEAAQVAIEIDEARTPIREAVKGFCEILGLDPLYLANEGKIVAVVPRGGRRRGARRDARASARRATRAIIGRVSEASRAASTMRTVFGGSRIVDMLVGEQLPRIC